MWYMVQMTKGLSQALETLRAQREALRGFGIVHAAIFGSTARGEDEQGSDIDLMVDFDPRTVLSAYDFAGIRAALSTMLGRSVDLVETRALKNLVRQEALRERVDAF